MVRASSGNGRHTVLGVFLYGFLTFFISVLFKSITRDDCLLLPKGERIARLLRL